LDDALSLRSLVLNIDVDSSILRAAFGCVVGRDRTVLAEGHSRQLIRIDALRLEVPYHRNRARGGEIPVAWKATSQRFKDRLVIRKALNDDLFAVEALQDR
jgi:hypothetical protein